MVMGGCKSTNLAAIFLTGCVALALRCMKEGLLFRNVLPRVQTEGRGGCTLMCMGGSVQPMVPYFTQGKQRKFFWRLSEVQVDELIWGVGVHMDRGRRGGWQCRRRRAFHFGPIAVLLVSFSGFWFVSLRC
ncbi:hypothetical protein I3842_07G196400 [Carya illinoinensis]|uniref:Secreted protein n=1 Tax=Carya illinoinensis TaxID=32201 RepID=A0A922JFH8_CARIL|nr:hypothetical protein I3842_07G196400 [Carya illinoinensis]